MSTAGRSERGVEDWRDAVWRAPPADAEPERFAERRELLLAQVAAGDRVLDLGCGDGAFAAALTGAGAVVTAVDVSGEAVRRARRRAPGAQVELVTEGGELPFAEDAFDLVWCGETLEHVADVAGLLAEVRRVLRWGGTLLVTTRLRTSVSTERKRMFVRSWRKASARGENASCTMSGASLTVTSSTIAESTGAPAISPASCRVPSVYAAGVPPMTWR